MFNMLSKKDSTTQSTLLQATRKDLDLCSSGNERACTLYPALIERDKDGDGWHLTPNSQVTYKDEGPTAKTNYNICSHGRRLSRKTELQWHDTALVQDAAAWQRLWFELEIINGLALAQWDDQGRPANWSGAWNKEYRQETAELVAMLCDADSSAC